MRSVRSAAQSIDLRRGSGILLAMLGLLGLAIIIYFKLEVDLPVKIALALAAGGIAGALPGSLIFKSRAVSAGGAVGVFCVVMFYDAGQAWVEPITKSTHTISSVTMSKKQMVIQNGLMSAQFELMRGEYGSAIDVIHQMLNLREDDRLALSMLGYSYFKLGNFHEAARAYERAFNTDPTKTDAAAAHNVATSSDVGGDSGKALEWNETAYNVVNRENNPTLWKEIVHDRGLFNLVAWMERSRGKVDIYYDRVRSSFKEFTEIGGEALFASYNLCCLYAVAGESLKVQQDEAQDNFATFIRMVNQPGQKTPTNSHVIDRLLGRGSAARGPGEPPSCPAIRTAFARHGWKINGKESWDELVGGGAQITDSGKKL